jgi:hypothetical protein
MSNVSLRERFRDEGLLPFQVEFLERFLAKDAPRYWQLIAPVGTGKTHLTLTLIRQLYESDSQARVLLVVPGALVRHWQERLVAEKASVPNVELLDRATLIELSSEAPKRPWPTGSLFITTHDLSAVPAVNDALTNVPWNLVVADESQLLTGKRANGFLSLLNSKNVRRALLLRAGAESEQEPDPLPLATARYKYGDIVGWNGQPLYSRLPVQLELIEYERTDQERALFESIETVAEQVAASTEPAISRFADLLLRAAASSTFAVDQRLREMMALLRPLRNAIVHGHMDQAAYRLSSQDQRSPTEATVDAAAITLLYGSVEKILATLAETPADAKLAALRKHLQSQLESSHPICVWTGLAATARYIGLSLDALPQQSYVLTAEQSLAESAAQLKSFEHTGGVLIATGAAIQTHSLTFVAGCVHYDLPSNRAAFDQRLGRFLRYGRTVPFRTWIMRDTRRSLKWEDHRIDRLLKPSVDSSTEDVPLE